MVARVVAVVGATALGLLTQRFPHADQQLYVVKFLALVVVSVFCASWPLIAAIEVALGIAWLLVVRRGKATLPARLVIDVNRTLGHIETLSPLLVLTILLDAPAGLRFGVFALIVVAGARSLDRIVAAWHNWRHGFEPTAAWLLRARRLPMYGVTVVGTLWLMALAPLQWRAFLPSTLAVMAGMALRVAATLQASRRKSGLSDRQWHQMTDVALALAVVGTVGWGAWILSRMPDNSNTMERISAGQCTPRPKGQPTISVFMVADSQFHELRGERSAAYLPMVDAVVPVAVRPVLSDLLTGVTLDQFARMYRTYGERNQSTQLSWAFLGDLGDVGCSTELERYPSYFQGFEAAGGSRGPGQLAGIASGNHDNTFSGNFLWHPDWDPACHVAALKAGTRLDKQSADRALRGLVTQFGHAGIQLPEGTMQCFAAQVEGRSALPMISPLGVLPGDVGSPPRPVVGVFLDTGDSALYQFGVAGSQGHVSQMQLDFAKARVPSDAWVVLFLHHPLEQLSPFSHSRVADFVTGLGTRVLLVVSAHTHVSAFHEKTRLGNVELGEFTVGAVIDSTQEGAVLEIRGSAGQPDVHVYSVPAVHRPDMDCVQLSDVDATSCVDHLAAMAQSCPAVTRVDWLPRKMRDPMAMTDQQRINANSVFRCLGLDPRVDALDPEQYTRWARADDALRRKLVCMSWAASLLQSHKGSGWRYVDAIRGAGEKTVTLGGLAVTVPRAVLR